MCLILLLFCLGGVSARYQQPQYEQNPLSEQENEELQLNCGRPYASSDTSNKVKRSMHTENSTRSSAPWVVSHIHNLKKWNPWMNEEENLLNSFRICSASIISDRHIITVAHCFQQLKNLLRDRFLISEKCGDPSGQYCKKEQQIQVLKVAKVYRPKNYGKYKKMTNSIHHGDIAIVELVDKIKFGPDVYPLCVGDFLPAVGSSLDQYGYGIDQFDGGRTDVLQHMEVKRVMCDEVETREEKIRKNDKICTKGVYVHSCSGDSGSSFVQEKNGRKASVALSSNSLHCSIQGRLADMGLDYIGDYNTAVMPHIHWICEATGICPNRNVAEEVKYKKNLPNRNGPSFATLVPPPTDRIHLQKV